MMKKYTILAPHVDDEVIGCWSKLRDGEVANVIYFYDLTERRRVEASASAFRFGFVDYSWDRLGDYNFMRGTTLLIPNWRDEHQDHKRVNRIGKNLSLLDSLPVEYYSVDMNWHRVNLPDCNEKRSALVGLFPSQFDYLNKNDACWLFEGITPTDVIEYATVDVATLTGVFGRVTVTVDSRYVSPVIEYIKEFQPTTDLNDLLNGLIVRFELPYCKLSTHVRSLNLELEYGTK